MAVGAALAAAALASGPVSAGAEAAPAKPRALLESTDSCAVLARHVRRVAAPRVRGLIGRPTITAAPVPVAEPGAAAPEGADFGSPVRGAVPPDFSGTNLQEAGVEEPDIVKTDGRRIFAIADGRLHAVDVTGASPRHLGALRVPSFEPTELLLFGDTLLAIGRDPTPQPSDDSVPFVVEPAPAPSTLFVQVDVTDPAQMRVSTRIRVDGSYVTARAVDDAVRLVLASTPEVPWVQPLGAGPRAEAQAAARNRRVVRRISPRRWLPRMAHSVAGRGTTRGRAVSCDAVWRPRVFAGLGMVTVMTLDVSGPAKIVDSDAVMSDGQFVYASKESLYVATPRWWDEKRTSARQVAGSATLIHRLDISSPAATEYLASGVVPGFPLNQFSFSERGGDLRVATTEAPAWWSGDTEALSESRVTVLRRADQRLEPIGRVGGLGRGERIFAVRFIEDRGYVVTFRQVDPLYVVDLSNPTAPRVRGELKIPGYSAYLHPVGPGRLIGIGRDATPDGRIRNSQVSLFDVSDSDNPRRLAQHDLGPGSSEAEFEHRAVLHWAPTGLLVLPIESFAGDSSGTPSFSGAEALRVEDAAIGSVRRVSHTGREGEGATAIRRSLVVDSTLYTVSEAGILSSDATTAEAQNWVAFP